MGSSASKREREQVERSYRDRHLQYLRELVSVHRELTSATGDLRRAYYEGVSAIRDFTKEEGLGNRSICSHLEQLQTELREISNTCRISAGGLPPIRLGRGVQEVPSWYDGNSMASVHSESSTRSTGHLGLQSPVTVTQCTPVELNQRKTEVQSRRHCTLTRENVEMWAGHNEDNDGYILPIN